jgi:hypothetical protein
MLPKSKRAKRRNRHTSGKRLYWCFKNAEGRADITNEIGVCYRNGVYWFVSVNCYMVGGKVVHG